MDPAAGGASSDVRRAYYVTIKMSPSLLLEVVTLYKSFTSANGGTLGPSGCYEVRYVLVLYTYIYGNRPGQQLLNHPMPLLCSEAQTAVVV